MTKRFATVGAVALMATACTSGQQVVLPPPGSIPLGHAYVADFGCTSTGLRVYQAPFSGASTPVVSVPRNSTSMLVSPGGLAVNSSNQVFVIDDGYTPSKIFVFAAPLTAASAPAITITLPSSHNAYQLAIDPAGNIWASDRHGATSQIFKYVPPFTNSSTPALTLTGAANGVNDAAGLAFDSAGNLAVAGEISSNVVVYTAPITGGSTPAATIALAHVGQGVAFDTTGKLYVTFFTANGGVAVFNPPFTNSSTPAFTFGTASTDDSEQANFDAPGNLWVTNSALGTVAVFPPPFSSSTTAAFTITAATSCPYGIAFGP